MTIMFWMMLSLFFGLCRLNSWGTRRPSMFLLSQNAEKMNFVGKQELIQGQLFTVCATEPCV